MSFYASWQLALMTFAVGVVFVFVLGPPIVWFMRLSIKYTDSLARSVQTSTEALGSMRTVISFGSEDFFTLLYTAAIGDINGPNVICWWPIRSHSTYRYGTQRSVMMNVMIQIALWVALSCVTLIMWYAYHLILNNELTFGDIYTFAMYSMNIALGFSSLSGGIG